MKTLLIKLAAILGSKKNRSEAPVALGKGPFALIDDESGSAYNLAKKYGYGLEA